MDANILYVFCIWLNFIVFGEVTSIVNQTNVEQHAQRIGELLWKIGSNITNRESITKRYEKLNASVEITEGEVILKTIATRMNQLIKEKVDAVMRIKNGAMDAESNFNSSKIVTEDVKYYNSKFSETTVTDPKLKCWKNYKLPDDNKNGYEALNLSPDPHFDEVLVNVNHSSVHVPTNIFDRWPYVIHPIKWSEELDKTFINNYKEDPSLMWQYFASVSGFLRHYPAFHWKTDPDRYDCRRQIWYIQAATCSKEVVILIDNSGTMYGMKNTIAILTVDSLLKTFSNNDYINIFKLREDNATSLVTCFEDTLIQATPENIELFKNFLYEMCPEKKTNYKVGFKRAFNMLHDFYLKRRQNESENHNQAVFLLTDMMIQEDDLTEIRNDYERIYNDTNVQVELFIYFVGRDIPDVQVVQWEKCLGKGSLIHVRTMDEVPEDALKYLSVLARTQNESTEYYPISWTHIFLDSKKDRGKLASDDEAAEDDEGEIYENATQHRLMTAVTTPVYTKKKPSNGNKEEFIGVAAIEVPISDFERLTMAHKIGVNGYAFVITNNGYVLFHPDLRPIKNGKHRANYNSIDLTEVEFYDDDETSARKPHERILKLRERMVMQEFGNETDMVIKFHFDDQRRVGSEIRNYYFAPLKCSPFSLGLALPRGYGSYWVKTTNKIEESKQNNENYTMFFKGDWQIHPKWSYCDYRDNRKYEFKDAKLKMLKFFEMIFKNDSNFEWIEEHPIEQTNQSYQETWLESFESCFIEDAKIENKEYYCDKELVELLYFDAKLTHDEFSETMSENTENDRTFADEHGIRVKFVATQGGLTRWKTYLEDEADQSFGEKYNKALDEVWYKSAVLLHETHSPKFVYSIPEDFQFNNKKETYTKKFITATHAIFYSERGNEAPGVVVGFQISFQFLENEIKNISACSENTKENQWDCYVIDSNGFIIYSRKENEIGKFFGTVVGGAAAMHQMVEYGIFRKVSMFDYQAMDERMENGTTISSSSSLLNPLSFLTNIVSWAVSHLVWFLIQTNLWQYKVSIADYTCTAEPGGSTNPTCPCKSKNRSCPICCKAPTKYADRKCKTREVLAHIESEKDYKARTYQKLVDKNFTLFLYTNLSATYYTPSDTYHKQCSRPFHAARMNKTNLILLLVDTLHETCENTFSIDQQVVIYEPINGDRNIIDTPACYKKMMNSYPRKKPRGCSDKIIENRTRQACGISNHIQSDWKVLISSTTMMILCSSFIIWVNDI